jgi:hypothetical protein
MNDLPYIYRWNRMGRKGERCAVMGAIREPRTITGTPEGWGKRVEVTVLGDREDGFGIDQMNQIADRLAGKVG